MRRLLILCLLLAGCSENRLLTRQDYDVSQRDFLQGKADRALANFPQRLEAGTFITTMERTYLSLVQGKPDIAALQKQAVLQENQVRYHVSREARTFFYVQTPEDYYPSEHEVIWMHFLLSWGYSLQGKQEDACVEARVAGSLLTLPWNPEGHFDDAAMRLMLAGLWSMCGDWREAQVDLRAAYDMDNRLAWAKELAERERPPAQLFVVLGGPGPEVEWSPEAQGNLLRNGRRVSFRLRGSKDPLSIADHNGVALTAYLSPDAGNWYERHLARETELHEKIEDSAYGGKAAARGTVAAGKIGWATALGVGFATVGVAFGVEIIHLAGSASSVSDALGMVTAGLGVGAYGVGEGMEISEHGYGAAKRELKEQLDPSLRYRYVRFLPEYLWMAWSDKPLAYPVELRTPSADIAIAQPAVSRPNFVTVAYMPEAGPARQSGVAAQQAQLRTPQASGEPARAACGRHPDSVVFRTDVDGCPPKASDDERGQGSGR